MPHKYDVRGNHVVRGLRIIYLGVSKGWIACIVWISDQTQCLSVARMGHRWGYSNIIHGWIQLPGILNWTSIALSFLTSLVLVGADGEEPMMMQGDIWIPCAKCDIWLQ